MDPAASAETCTDPDQCGRDAGTGRYRVARRLLAAFSSDYLDRANNVRDHMEFSYSSMAPSNLLDYLDAGPSYREWNLLRAFRPTRNCGLRIHPVELRHRNRVAPMTSIEQFAMTVLVSRSCGCYCGCDNVQEQDAIEFWKSSGRETVNFVQTKKIGDVLEIPAKVQASSGQCDPRLSSCRRGVSWRFQSTPETTSAKARRSPSSRAPTSPRRAPITAVRKPSSTREPLPRTGKTSFRPQGTEPAGTRAGAGGLRGSKGELDRAAGHLRSSVFQCREPPTTSLCSRLGPARCWT